MLQFVKYLQCKIWQLLAGLIILLALLLTLLRVALPLIDLTDYRAEIEQAVEQRIGMPLRFHTLHAQLRAARLALKVDNISLLDPQTKTPRIHFREAYIKINLLRSLFNGELILGRVLLVGGRLSLLRDRDGVFSVNGFRLGDGHHFAIGPLLSRLQLSVRDCEIHWQDRLQDTAPMHLYQVNGRLDSDSRRHRLALVSQIGLEGKERIRLAADLREGKADPLAMEGRIYLKTENLALDNRLPAGLTDGLRVERGRLDLELWSELVGGRFQRLQGKVELNGLQLSSEHSASLGLDRFAALFDWRGKPHDWQLDLDRLVMLSERQLWPPGRLSLAWRTDDLHKQVQLGIDYLALSEASRFAILSAPLGEDIRKVLVGLGPAGHLSRFRLALDQAADQPARWQVSGSVSQYSQQPWKAVPGLAGLNLSFAGDQDGGGLRLGSNRFVMDMPRLFRDQLTADKLRGNFQWGLDPVAGLHMKTQNLTLVTPDVKTLSRLDLQLPWDGEHPFIDMQTDFWDGDGAQKSRYLPAGIMPAPLVDWLDRSLVSGHVTSGSMLLYGPLKAFPFRHDEGRFEVLFGIEDMVLDYKARWPRLEEVVAEAHFLNNGLTIDLSEGKILDSRLRPTEARIQHLKGASPVEIDGAVEGPVQDLLRLLNETPLKQKFARFTDAVDGSGQARTTLQLQIPLKKTDVLQIHGKVDFQRSSLRLKDYDLTLQALVGQLNFNDKQLWGSDIRGRVLDQSVVLQVEPVSQDGQTETRIRTALKIGSDWLQQRFPGLATVLDGESQAAVVLDIAHGSSRIPVSLTVRSDLQGMAVEVPEPLDKSRSQTRNLDLRLDFMTDRERDLHIAYGDLAHAWLRYRGEAIRRGEVRFGGESPQLPLAELLRLRGSLPRLDLDDWIDDIFNEPAGRGQATIGTQTIPLQLDLQLGELNLLGVDFPQVRFQVEPVAGAWQASFASEALNGNIVLPQQPDLKPVVVRLKQLHLERKALLADEPEQQAAPARPAAHELELDPQSLPGLDMQVDALWVGDKPLGKASLEWDHSNLGIQIKQFVIHGEDLEFDAKGYWHLIGRQNHSQFQVKAHVKSLGRLQKDLGLKLGITKAPLDLNGVFEWSQAPYAIKLKDLTGKLDLKMGAGEVTEVDPGVGRLVGLFSLHTLGKRLSLDFSDLFAKGLEFDKIEGQFDIRDGDAYTNNLVISSPAAQILITGKTGLATRYYDQLVTVIPRVSSTLPLVGAIAGGPAVGVALVVTQELFGKQVDRIIQSQYKLTGSWDAPTMVRLTSQKEDEDGTSSMMPDLPAR